MLKKLFFVCQVGALTGFSSMIGEADDPQIAIDGNGNAVVFWEELENNHYAVRSASYLKGMGWQAAQTFSGGVTDAFDPEAAMNRQGDTIAVWRQYAGGYYAIFAASSVLGADWNSPVQLSSASSSYAKIGVDALGRGVAVWQQLVSAGVNRIAMASFHPHTGWSNPSFVSDPGATILAPDFQTSSNGRSIAAWQMPSNQSAYYRPAIQAAYYSTETGWSSPLFLSNLNYDAVAPSVAINASGEGLVVWEGGDGSGPDRIYLASLAADGTWGPATALSETQFIRVKGGVPLVLSASYPDVALNDAGQAAVVWQTSDMRNQNCVRAVVRSSAGVWGPEVFLAEYDSTQPKVAINSDGKAVAIWISGGMTLFAAVYEGSSWGLPQLISDPYNKASEPEVRVNADGTAFLVWQSVDANQTVQILASALSTDNAWSAPFLIH